MKLPKRPAHISFLLYAGLVVGSLHVLGALIIGFARDVLFLALGKEHS